MGDAKRRKQHDPNFGKHHSTSDDPENTPSEAKKPPLESVIAIVLNEILDANLPVKEDIPELRAALSDPKEKAGVLNWILDAPQETVNEFIYVAEEFMPNSVQDHFDKLKAYREQLKST